METIAWMLKMIAYGAALLFGVSLLSYVVANCAARGFYDGWTARHAEQMARINNRRN